ncbi:hypothetical protein [Streptomyces canus]|uniref:hypothetical protein n=1 Tax=Streptomyces canus TaxID=58343 RepID=UPI000376034E|nr:hypothetical protein [Streptomyces canus]
MSDPKLRLVIDGVDVTGEYDTVEASTPRAVHVIPTRSGSRRQALGPASFTLLITAPSDRLYGLADGGKRVHEVKLVADWINHSITHPTHFHWGWVDDGIRKMFGSLAPDRAREAKWVEELPARASTATEGN